MGFSDISLVLPVVSHLSRRKGAMFRTDHLLIQVHRRHRRGLMLALGLRSVERKGSAASSGGGRRG